MPLLVNEIEAAKTSLAAERYDAGNRPYGKKRMRIA